MLADIVDFLTNDDTGRDIVGICVLLTVCMMGRTVKRFFTSFSGEDSGFKQNIIASVGMTILLIILCVLEYQRLRPEQFFESFPFALFCLGGTLLFIFNYVGYYLGYTVNHFVVSFMMLLLFIIMLSLDRGGYGIQYLLFPLTTSITIIISLRNRKN